MGRFWRRWLDVWCGAVALFGVVLAAAGFAATAGPSQALLAVMGSAGPAAFDPAMRFAVGLMGCVSLGWGLTLLVTMQALHALGPRATALWRRLLAAVAVWYAIDSLISVETGFALNALSNTLFMVAFVLPLVRSGVLGPPRQAGAAAT